MFIKTAKGIEIDPNYLTINNFMALYLTAPTKELSECLLGYVYHMLHPKSPFETYSAKDRSGAIIKNTFPKEFRHYDPSKSIEMEMALDTYGTMLQNTPLHYAARSYKEAIYQFSDIIKDPTKSAQEKKIAAEQLDTLPAKYEKMKLQAEKETISLEQAKGDRDITEWERPPAM